MTSGAWIAAAAAALALSGPVSAADVPQGRVLEFAVYRQGSEIGTHRLTFEPDGERMRVKVAIDLAVSFGPFVLYRYTHRSTELWERGELRSLEADTDDDGHRLHVHAEAHHGRLEISGPEGESVGPPDLMPSSYWDSRLVTKSVLLDLHYGNVQPVRVTKLKPEIVEVPGAKMTATPYHIDGGYADLTAWYTDNGEWVKLKALARGSEIDYVLRTPPRSFAVAVP